ncbi:hypothetical protein BGW38_000057 [Lunasporangiospora selenospora]|uniref:Concentrative nucleoside transporter, CNT family n=1 Tax=Lunasporangiospora selenospora TaxID=979761 RepID=A0A9P6FVM7_9FUNG|nr:hypothetical protein BGW38_000057 [Lunasporangiospora selenospora]
MSGEQTEVKDAPSRVEQEIYNEKEKDQTLFQRRRADEEDLGDIDDHSKDAEDNKKVFGLQKKRFTQLVHAVIWVLFTAFLIAAIIIKKGDPISVLAVAYAFTTLYFISCHVPDQTFSRPTHACWSAGAGVIERLPTLARQVIGYGLFPVAMILTAVVREDNDHGTRVQRVISLCGLLFFLLALFVTSRNRRAIHWPTVTVGIGLQFLLGLFVIRTYIGETIFSYIGKFMASFLGFSRDGIAFVVGEGFMNAYGMTFLCGVLPAIVFFGAVIQVLYYYNVIQTAIGNAGKVIVYFFEISGVEVIAALAAPFVGMSESAMLVGPYLEHATNAEIHQVLASGFATISGSMRYPEEEVPLTRGKDVKLERPDAEDSFVHALANGSILGMQLCIVITAVLIGFLSLLGCANYVLNWVFVFLGVTDITLQRLLGYFFYPFAWLLGMPAGDVYRASKMMGVKFVLNEFVGFAQAQSEGFFTDAVSARARLLATFACCSFANPSSLGSQISLLGKMAPTRAGDIARVAVSAVMVGALSTIMSACIAGIVL